MVWYEYDALNRPVRVYTNRLATEPWDVTSYEYGLPLDQPTRVDLPGGTEPVHVYEYLRGRRMWQAVLMVSRGRYGHKRCSCWSWLHVWRGRRRGNRPT